jgi:hypothetical protein
MLIPSTAFTSFIVIFIFNLCLLSQKSLLTLPISRLYAVFFLVSIHFLTHFQFYHPIVTLRSVTERLSVMELLLHTCSTIVLIRFLVRSVDSYKCLFCERYFKV